MKPLRLMALVLCVLCLPSLGLAAERPNLIFVLSDDIAQGDLGVYGQELIQTPNLDRLCNEGTRYLSTAIASKSGAEYEFFEEVGVPACFLSLPLQT